MCDTDPCFLCWCCPQYDTENEHGHQRDALPEPIELGYYLNECPPSPPQPSVDSLLYPSHYLSTLHPIVVQPPPNVHGAHKIRRLTHDQRFIPSDLLPLPPSSSPGPMIYVVSNGILTSSRSSLPPLRPPRWHPTVAPGRAVRTLPSQTRAPPGYTANPPSRGGAETAEPPPYPEEEPPPLGEAPAYPGRGDGTMSAPPYQRRDRI